jgi:hypothetical protein
MNLTYLFIFLPVYPTCYGVAAVIASDFEKAVELLEERAGDDFTFRDHEPIGPRWKHPEDLFAFYQHAKMALDGHPRPHVVAFRYMDCVK